MKTIMNTFIVAFPARKEASVARAPVRTFYDLAKKHIVKGKRGGPPDLSKRIDEVAYGI